MTSLSYPQMMHSLQLQTNEPTSMPNNSSMINPLDRSIGSNLSLMHFYHDPSKPLINNEQNSTTSLHNQNDNLAFRTMSNVTKSIEII